MSIQHERKGRRELPPPAVDDLVVDPIPVVAADCRMSVRTLRAEIARGTGPKVTKLSPRREGIQRRHRREWLDQRAEPAA
jgi:hypothetical protein